MLLFQRLYFNLTMNIPIPYQHWQIFNWTDTIGYFPSKDHKMSNCFSHCMVSHLLRNYESLFLGWVNQQKIKVKITCICLLDTNCCHLNSLGSMDFHRFLLLAEEANNHILLLPKILLRNCLLWCVFLLQKNIAISLSQTKQQVELDF